MQSIQKLTLIIFLFLVNACSTTDLSDKISSLTFNLEEESIEQTDAEIEQEMLEEEQITESEKLENVKDPQKFVKYYLRSKFSLYNSTSLDEITENNYQVSLENPDSFQAQEQAFILSLANQNYANAINILNNKTTTQELAFENLFLYSKALAENDKGEAKAYLKELLNTQNRLPLLKIINAYFTYNETKDINQLKIDIAEINSSTALDGFKYYYTARAYEQMGDYATAFKLYSSAYFVNTLRTTAVFERLVYTARKLDFKNTKDIFKSNNQYGENIYLVDQTFVDVEKIKELDNSLAAISAQAFYDLGWSIVQTNSNLAGLNFLALSDYIKPTDTAKIQLARGYYNNTWEDSAIKLLESVKSDSEQYISAQIFLADIIKDKDTKKAVQILQGLKKSTDLNHHYVDTIIGQVYLNNEEYKAAIPYLNSALVNDKSSKVYFSRAVAYERTSQYELAIDDLNTALDKNPKNPIILNYLGYLLIDLHKDIERGFLLIEESLRLDPLNPATLDSLGWALLKQKEYEKGLNYLEKAYSINSQDGVITGHLADAYYLNGRTKEAIIYWKKALELEKKDHREIERIKNQLYKYNK